MHLFIIPSYVRLWRNLKKAEEQLAAYRASLQGLDEGVERLGITLCEAVTSTKPLEGHEIPRPLATISMEEQTREDKLVAGLPELIYRRRPKDKLRSV